MQPRLQSSAAPPAELDLARRKCVFVILHLRYFHTVSEASLYLLESSLPLCSQTKQKVRQINNAVLLHRSSCVFPNTGRRNRRTGRGARLWINSKKMWIPGSRGTGFFLILTGVWHFNGLLWLHGNNGLIRAG